MNQSRTDVSVDEDTMRSFKDELVETLELDGEENQDSIVLDILSNGRKALSKYQSNIRGKIYKEMMANDGNKLITLLKQFFEQQWGKQYDSTHGWFSSFLKDFKQGDQADVYERFLSRTAEHGNRFQKNSPILSIALQLLFESIDDDELLEANIFDDQYLEESRLDKNKNSSQQTNYCDELWFSITHYGLISITNYRENIRERVMNQQLNKTQSILFKALREYYKPQLFPLLETHKIANRENRHDLILENVAEYGWLTGIGNIQDELTPKVYEKLLKDVDSLVKQRKAKRESIQKNEAASHVQSNDLQSGGNGTNLTTTSNPMPELIQSRMNDLKTDTLSQSSISVESMLESATTTSEDSTRVVNNENEKKKVYITNLSQDLPIIPVCAERTTIELLLHYVKRLCGYKVGSDEKIEVESLQQQLENQMKLEELTSVEVISQLNDFKMSVSSDDCKSVINILENLLKSIRPINMHEIKRLMNLANESAELIAKQDIVLLLGSTGVGKSTTIHFLAGSRMKHVKVPVSDGQFLDHIAPVEPAQNCDLSRVLTSAWSISETRYIWPVMIPLKNIASGKIGHIILCDTPGFADTSGPEVDIANSLGVVKALSACKTVKILALSSYVNLGDRGQGIQDLAHILSKMINDVEGKLQSIFYVFTKYPPDKNDIYPRLLDIKERKVANDPSLLNDISFVKVLDNMIKKTKNGAFKVDPLNSDLREELIDKIERLQPIKYPKETFRYAMSKDTSAAVRNYVQRSELNIVRAMKRHDIDLAGYHLNNLKTLKGWIHENFIQTAYENSARFISENIEQYCQEVTGKFNRVLESQDGLRQEDVREYQKAIEYIDSLEKPLNDQLQSCVPKSERFMHNIKRELAQKRRVLEEAELQSHLVEVYLANFSMLKDSFPELNLFYRENCELFEQQFNKLVESVNEKIVRNEFDKVVEIMFILSKSSCNLKRYLGEQLEEKFHNATTTLLTHLQNYVEKSEPLLQKIRLNNDDLQQLKSYLDILRSAKETTLLQECISTCSKRLPIELRMENNNSKFVNEIYNEFIEKVVQHFDEISGRIEQIFTRSGDGDLETIENFVQDMNNLREIPEIEVKTSASYYRTIERINEYIQQLQKYGKQLIIDIEQRTGNINYRHLHRFLSSIKDAQWINRATPGAYDRLISRIKEQLIDNTRILEEQLMALKFHLKHPENVNVAYAIVEKIESMCILENFIPELKEYREKIQNTFRVTTQTVLDNIKKQFNLQDRRVSNLNQRLNELERIKIEYENLRPSQKYIFEQQYSNIDQLNDEITSINEKIQQQIANERVINADKEDEVKKFQDIIDHCIKNPEQTRLQRTAEVLNVTRARGSSEKIMSQKDYLREHGFSNIDEVYKAKLNSIESYNEKLQQSQTERIKLNNQLCRSEKIKKQYQSLLSAENDSPSSAQISYLQERSRSSIESVVNEIQEKQSVILKHEQNRHEYVFSDRFDNSIANFSLIYSSECERVRETGIKQTADETNKLLDKYFLEYGLFLKREMLTLYENGKKSDIAGGPFRYCHELSIRLEEVSSTGQFPEVFRRIEGAELLLHWTREIFSFYTISCDQMAEFQKQGESDQLGKQLIVIKAFIFLDRFCGNNQFHELHRTFQSGVMNDLAETYKQILTHIGAFDYVRASNTLTEISDRPLNVKARRQIELELQSSLVKLMKDTKRSAQWLYGKIDREENQTKFQEIVTNVEKIHIALTRLNLMELLDKKTTEDLEKFPAEIDRILSEMILEALRSIETYMNSDNFAQAEEGFRKINNVVEQHLNGVINDERIISGCRELRNKLNELVTNISNRINFIDIDKYFEKPPKDLLDNLQLLARNNNQYNQVHIALLGKLRKDLKEMLEKISELPMRQRSAKLRALTHALSYIPEDLQNEFKAEINEMTESNRSMQRDLESDLSRCFNAEQENEQTLKKISKLAQDLKEQGIDELTDRMHGQILKNLQDCRTQLQTALEASDMQGALQHMDRIIKYKDHVSKHFPGIRDIYDSSRKIIAKSFTSCSKLLAEISKIEKAETAENAFKNK